jgi:hypothetical protein
LIEGVNTSAKNVIVFDNTIARARYDYFGNPPPRQLDIVDIPIFIQTDRIPDNLIIQMDRGDVAPRLRDRFRRFDTEPDLSFATLKANKHVNPDDQIALAKYLLQNIQQASAMLQWTQFPTYDELEYVCGLMDEFFVDRWGVGAYSARQLAFKINRLRQNQSIYSLILEELANPEFAPNADAAISNVLDFMRQWAMHNFPRFLMAISTIQAEVLGRMGRPVGDFSFFAARAENLFLPPALMALDEYGLPLQIAQKLGLGQGHDDEIDDVVPQFRSLDVTRFALSIFERYLVNEVRQDL